MITLYAEKKNCCGCSACMNICPKQAITMKPDVDGFIYPTINNDLCVECRLCKRVCAFQNEPVSDNEPIATYAAINKDKSVLEESTSGGIFGAIASIIFEKSGIVFGCAFNSAMESEHICINSILDMKKLQGSKYVQSNINNTYADVKKYLKEDVWVLFTGTPCQIAGLKSYLEKDYNKLITIDLICHGVPSKTFFEGYIRYLEEKLNGDIIDFKFRDKSKGWGHVEKVVYEKKGIIKYTNIQPFNSYYHSYFLKGDILRENCYECKYACSSREGDFTMGDYWGVEKCHPKIERENGISVLLINTSKGLMFIDELKKYLNLTESTFEQARKQNGQLNMPMAKSVRRDAILKTWHEGGYKAVAEEYYKENKNQIVLSRLKMLVPHSMRQLLKRMIK
ncbi:MAG: Coenzyme F420 hydrogenase/dehydrogenase, beta subunit C-terminal domain [Clostridium sp.]